MLCSCLQPIMTGVLEYVCEVNGVDYADGFDPAGRELVAPWNGSWREKKVRVYKLHGSVTYYVDQAGSGAPSFLRLDRGYPLPGPGFRLSREGKDLEPLMVLPTREKDALGDPYGHLTQIFASSLAECRLVIAVGTSLRDDHLVSALNYNRSRIVVLVVDSDPAATRARIANVAAVQLKADTRVFLEGSIGRLIDVTRGLEEEMCREEIHGIMEEFAAGEVEGLARLGSLTSSQRAAVMSVEASECEGEVLAAFARAWRGGGRAGSRCGEGADAGGSVGGRPEGGCGVLGVERVGVGGGGSR